MSNSRFAKLGVLVFAIAATTGLTLSLAGCEEQSKSAAVASVKLNPEEEGNLQLLKPYIDRVVGDYAKANIAQQRYNTYKQENDQQAADLEATKYNQALDRLKTTLLNLQPAPPGPQLQVAPSLAEVMNSVIRFEALRHNLRAGPVTQAEAQQLYALAGEVYFADKRLAEELSSRASDYSGVVASNNFTAEIGFMKVDFAKGEVKIKHSWKTGPVKWSAGTGPGRGGIRTLIVQDATTRRVFAVGGKPIEVYVQESVIRTDGSVMTVTAVE